MMWWTGSRPQTGVARRPPWRGYRPDKDGRASGQSFEAKRNGSPVWHQTLICDSLQRLAVSREARCERNNSNSHTVGLHKHGSSTRLRYTVPGTQTHLCNSTRQRLLCHSGTKAHLHKPSGRRPLYHSIAGTKTCLRNPTRRWLVRHSGTKAHLPNSDNTAITLTGRC
jgi:hypothetical protein